MQLETAELEKGLVRTLVDVIGHRLARDKNNRPNVISLLITQMTKV